MAPEQTSGRPGGTVAEAKDKGEELVSAAQQQITSRANELGGDAMFQIREQLDQRSTQAGEQLQSIGRTLQSGVNQLRSEGKDVPARVVEEVARRADDIGDYLQSAEADRILGDIEEFARQASLAHGERRRPRRTPRLTIREGVRQPPLRGCPQQRQRLLAFDAKPYQWWWCVDDDRR